MWLVLVCLSCGASPTRTQPDAVDPLLPPEIDSGLPAPRLLSVARDHEPAPQMRHSCTHDDHVHHNKAECVDLQVQLLRRHLEREKGRRPGG